MLDWDRAESIVLSLPPDYHGKTLTVAQATSLGERQEPEADQVVWPCSVQLYCGYSYESGLISESFQTAIPATLCFGGRDCQHPCRGNGQPCQHSRTEEAGK